MQGSTEFSQKGVLYNSRLLKKYSHSTSSLN